MKNELKKLERGQAEITIELSEQEFQPFLEQAAKKISETTKIKGFRPGKANFELIKSHVGEGELWQQAIEPAIKKTFVKALDEQKLVTIGSPKIDVLKLAPGNPIVYKALISFIPKVELADYAKIKVENKKIEIGTEDVTKALDNLRKMHAKETLVDREAQTEDKVEINFETFLDKIPVDHGKQDKFQLVIGEGSFIPGFEDQITGLKKDEEKKFQLKFPKEYHQKHLAGKLVDFKIKLKAVYKLELPALTDQFAQSLGDFKTVSDLETKIKKNLTAEQTRKQNQNLEEEIIDKIINQSKFDEIPDLMVNAETKKMVDELEHNLSHQGLKFDDYLIHLKKKREDLLLDFVPQAIKRIKSALILRAVAKKASIKIDEKEIDQEIAKTLKLYAGNKQAEENLRQPAYRDYLKNILIARKVMEHLKSAMVE